MDEIFRKILNETTPLSPVEGASKVMPLAEAVRRQVRPGATIHLGKASTPAAALI